MQSDSISWLNQRLRPYIEKKGLKCPGEAANCLLTEQLYAEGKIDGPEANMLLEEASGVRAIDPDFISFSDAYLRHVEALIPKHIALSNKVFPIKHIGDRVHLLMANPADQDIVDQMEAVTGSRISRYCCYADGILKTIDLAYKAKSAELELNPEKISEDLQSACYKYQNQRAKTIDELILEPALIHFIHSVMQVVTSKGISDIHFEHQIDSFRIRIRQDGVLRVAWVFPKIIGKAVITRLKLLSGMEHNNDVKPQDGRIDYHLVEGKEFDIRVSVVPGVYGEKMVMRLLDKGKDRISLEDMGIGKALEARILKAIQRPTGLLLLTGPTGSGKTTTLYSLLAILNTAEVNISTVEDPVEYELEGITQVNCGAQSEIGFSDALRAFMRQDPDIIMLGEIRDLDTADTAVKASLTGHLVLSTLHTNDAPSAVSRLVNLGVPPFLLAGCGLNVIAQRLVRRTCSQCKHEYQPTKKELLSLGIQNMDGPWYLGKGCKICDGTGYKGRAAILEMLTVDDKMEELILKQKGVADIRKAARKAGMVTLREDGIEKIRQGLTTIEEVLRVTLED